MPIFFDRDLTRFLSVFFSSNKQAIMLIKNQNFICSDDDGCRLEKPLFRIRLAVMRLFLPTAVVIRN
jgi:hypothetical protein